MTHVLVITPTGNVKGRQSFGCEKKMVGKSLVGFSRAAYLHKLELQAIPSHCLQSLTVQAAYQFVKRRACKARVSRISA